MRKLLALSALSALGLLLSAPVFAQSSLSRLTVQTNVNNTVKTNGTNSITGLQVNTALTEIINSVIFGQTDLGLNVLTTLSFAINGPSGIPNIDGSITSGDCLKWGPGIQDAGSPCGSGGGGSGTVNAGTSGQVAVYASSGTAVSGATPTGTGSPVLATSPTLVTPALGTPSAVVLTNGTGLPIAGITGLGTNVGTALGTNAGAASGFAAISGTLTPGDCVNVASGPTIADAGGPCTTGGGGGTVSSGTTGQLAIYASSGTTVSGAATAAGNATALGHSPNTTGGFALFSAAGSGILNASGSAQNTTGTISASSATLTLASAKDFIDNEGIRVNHAGAAFTLNAPTGMAVTPEGAHGSTTWQYKIASIDANCGVGAATALFQTTTGNATLGYSNNNFLTWTDATGTAPVGYAVYRNISGTYTLIGISANGDDYFIDYGYTAFPFVDWLPATAPASSLADCFVTTISSGGGGTSLTLAANATTAATTQGVYHDDGAAVNAALIAGPIVAFPAGTFYIANAAGLTVPANETISGQFNNTIIQSVFVAQNVFNAGNFNGNNKISNLTFNLVPGATAINAVEWPVAWVDNIICNGGATGDSGQGACVYLDGVYSIYLDNIYNQGWDGVVGFGTGGIPPSIITDQTGGATNNINVYMSRITMLNQDTQVMREGPVIQFNNCYNCSLSQSYLNANWGATGSEIFGLTGVEWEGPSQALNISGTQTLGFAANIRADSTANGSPLTMNITNNHFDFCGQYCLLLQDGSWVDVTNSSFVGEGNSPWNLSGNFGIYTSASFTSGPNTFTANTINGFSGAGAFGVRFSATMSNTTTCANQYTNNTTNFSGTAGSNSHFGCSNSPN